MNYYLDDPRIQWVIQIDEIYDGLELGMIMAGQPTPM